jgi:hypothetical protein
MGTAQEIEMAMKFAQYVIGNSLNSAIIAKKLLQIRRSLGLSQGDTVQRLGIQKLIHSLEYLTPTVARTRALASAVLDRLRSHFAR